MTNNVLWKQYEWITGGDANVKHEKKIDAGAYGEVHKVLHTADCANRSIVDRAILVQGLKPGCIELTTD